MVLFAIGLVALPYAADAMSVLFSSPETVVYTAGLGLAFRSGYETFDAEHLTGDTGAAGDMSTVNVQIKNLLGYSFRMELFNYLKSWIKITNVGDYPDKLAATVNNIVAAADLKGLIFIDDAGVLNVCDETDESKRLTITVTTKDLTYGQLFEASGKQAIRISKMYMTVTNDAQIDNEISFFMNTIFGKIEAQSKSPRDYFNPMQFQGKKILLPVDWTVTEEMGMSQLINNNETVVFNFSAQRVASSN